MCNEIQNEQARRPSENRTRSSYRNSASVPGVMPLTRWIAESDEHIVIQSSSEFALQ